MSQTYFERLKNGNKCEVEGCDLPPRTPRSSLCKKHYMRQYRHGSVEKTSRGSGISASNGRRYRKVLRPDHPLAQADGLVYVHRMVLYDKIGPGPQKCHWCNKVVYWRRRGQPAALIVDHLDNMGDNNVPENLVPACNGCNTARAIQAREALLLVNGWWSGNDQARPLPRRAEIVPFGVHGESGRAVRRAARDRTVGVAYVFGHRSGDGPVKIGSTVEIVTRARSIRVGTGEGPSPVGLDVSTAEVLLAVAGGLQLERWLQRELHSSRVIGEWFDLGPAPKPVETVMALVQQYLSREW